MSKFISFYDEKGYLVELSLGATPFSIKPKHVLVIPFYKGSWLFIQHPKRGIEFPGGKVEKGETVEEAAKRELFEEAGAIINELHFVGQYKVNDPDGDFVKNIYFGLVDQLIKKDNYLETNGPFLMKDFPLNLKNDDRFSFIMKDQVIELGMKEVNEKWHRLLMESGGSK